MNYELAKQLKDAGFPQKFESGDKYFEGQGICFCGECFQNELQWATDDNIKIPSLSELIEACDWGFRSLSKHSDGRWLCKTGARFTGKPSKLIKGYNSEEAVAKLYLELNKSHLEYEKGLISDKELTAFADQTLTLYKSEVKKIIEEFRDNWDNAEHDWDLDVLLERLNIK